MEATFAILQTINSGGAIRLLCWWRFLEPFILKETQNINDINHGHLLCKAVPNWNSHPEFISLVSVTINFCIHRDCRSCVWQWRSSQFLTPHQWEYSVVIYYVCCRVPRTVWISHANKKSTCQVQMRKSFVAFRTRIQYSFLFICLVLYWIYPRMTVMESENKRWKSKHLFCKYAYMVFTDIPCTVFVFHSLFDSFEYNPVNKIYCMGFIKSALPHPTQDTRRSGKYIADANWCVIFFSKLLPGGASLVLCAKKNLVLDSTVTKSVEPHNHISGGQRVNKDGNCTSLLVIRRFAAINHAL